MKTVVYMVLSLALFFLTAHEGFAVLQQEKIVTPIPQDMLDLDKKRCMQGCEVGNDKALCEKICNCSIQKMSESFDFDAYLTFSTQLLTEAISEKNRKILDTIAQQCVSQLPSDQQQIMLDNPDANADTGSSSEDDK